MERREHREYRVEADRTTVLMFHDNVPIGAGRWDGARIEGLDAKVPPDILAELARGLAAEEQAAVAALHAGACNDEGVDLTLIDWIRRMTPRERFAMLERYTGIPYRGILDVLTRHAVEFIVVGGVAAHFYGASYQTKDMDLVYARSPENIARLLAALEEMETIFRDFAGRRIAPNASYLASPNPKLLLTTHGPLDLLGTLSMEDDDTGYESLVGDAEVADLEGITVKVLALPRLIAVKERLRRQRDLLVLPLLHAALERAKVR